MITHIHMQDQIHNRIDDLMSEGKLDNWSELLQNVATLALIVIFMVVGINWA